MVKSIVSFICIIIIIIRGGREGRKRKQIEKKWEKQDKTKENSRTRERLTLTISSETPDVLSGFASLMVASSPMMNEGCVIIDETTQILRYKNTSFTSLLLTLRVVFATLPSVEIQGLTKMEKEREKMRAVLPFLYKTNTQKFSVRVHGIYGKKLNCIDSLQHRRVLRERVVFALLHRLRGQIVEEAVSPLKLFHRGWEVRNRVRVR